MRELTLQETGQVNGGHPVVWVVGAVIKSTAVRSVVKGLIGGGAAWLGWKLFN